MPDPITKLQAQLESDTPSIHFFLGKTCPLLGAARHARQNNRMDELHRLLGDGCPSAANPDASRIPWFEHLSIVALENTWSPTDTRQASLMDAHPLSARRQVILGQLDDAVAAYAGCWHYEPWLWNFELVQKPTRHTAVVRELQQIESLEGLRQKLDQMAHTLPDGWYNPALLLVAESLVAIWGDQPLSGSYLVNDHVLLATGQSGLVARLVLERMEKGCGAMYPHPQSMGYLRTAKSFQVGLQNAWFAEIGRHLGVDSPIDFDIRWSLELEDREDHPIDCEISGRSAEVAIACALRALRKREGLDDNAATSASLGGPLRIDREEDPVTRTADETDYIRLHPVGSLDLKGLAKELSPWAEKKRITQIVIAQGQTDPAPGDTWDNSQIRFEGAYDLDEAYRKLAKFAPITLRVNRQLAREAEQHLRTECNPYVPSSFSRYVEPESGRQSMPEVETDPYQQLARGERDKIVRGDPVPEYRRVRFYAESGLGKSMLLMHSQYEIAARHCGEYIDCNGQPVPQSDRPPQVPVLVRLPEFALTSNDSVWQRLVPRFAKPEYTDVDETATLKWLKHLHASGQLVFLLDAVDQTEDQFRYGLRAWLDDGVGSCLVRLTGRPWAIEKTKAPAIGANWPLSLRVNGFDRGQQEEFLGATWSKVLLPQHSDGTFTATRKAQWADLTRVPLLLRFLRELAQAEQLDELHNRERIYSVAIGRLIDQGIDNAPAGDEIPTPERARRFYAQLAWLMVKQQDLTGAFTGEVHGTDLQAIADKLEVSLNTLTQNNVVQLREARQMIYATTTSLEWRHLSFCEYFAGVELAGMTCGQQRAELAAILNQVEAVKRAENVRKHKNETVPVHRSPFDRWRLVFRFALCHLAASENKLDELVSLAGTLIEHGDPYSVYEALADDKIVPDHPVLEPLRQLTRWLVRQTWNRRGRNYADECGDASMPATDFDALRLVQRLLRREYRQGPVLAPAWELVVAGIKSQDDEVKQLAETIEKEFAGELPAAEEVVLTNLLERGFMSCPGERAGETDGLKPWGDGRHFVFPMSENHGDKDAPHHWVRIERFAITSFTVSNAELELLDPSHYWLRDEYSRADDQPALYVNWHLADLYCRVWLALQSRRLGRDETYGLPTECQAEFAIRVGTASQYWWGDEFDSERCNTERQVRWTLTREETLAAGTRYQNGYGVYHASGDAWIWCADWYEADHYGKRTAIGRIPEGLAADGIDRVCAADGGPSEWGSRRVIRGGSWTFDSGNSRSASRNGCWPRSRYSDLGFRVARSPSGQDR